MLAYRIGLVEGQFFRRLFFVREVRFLAVLLERRVPTSGRVPSGVSMVW